MAKLRNLRVIAAAGALAIAGCGSDEPREPGRAEGEMTGGGEQAGAEEAGQVEAEEDAEMAGADSEAGLEELAPSEIAQGARPEDARDEQSAAKVAPGKDPSQLNDNEIARIADVVNTGEIEQAELAQQKAQHPQVRQFAARMIREHGMAKRDGQQLVERQQLIPEDNAIATELQNGSTQTLESLRAAQGAEFDRQYMKSQVQQHELALDVIDRELMPSASSPDLRSELEETRQMIESHLNHAREIQQALAQGVEMP